MTCSAHSASITTSFNFSSHVEDWQSFKHFIHHADQFPSNMVFFNLYF